MAVSPSFHAPHDRDSFEHCSGTLQVTIYCNFPGVFLEIRLRSWALERKTVGGEGPFSSFHLRGHVPSACLIIGDGTFDGLAETALASFLRKRDLTKPKRKGEGPGKLL